MLLEVCGGVSGVVLMVVFIAGNRFAQIVIRGQMFAQNVAPLVLGGICFKPHEISRAVLVIARFFIPQAFICLKIVFLLNYIILYEFIY